MENSKIDSLYSLIKQKSQEKGGSLKIVCDWDECLQPFNPLNLYKTLLKGKSKGLNVEEDFSSFFKSFHENNEIDMKYQPDLPFAAYERGADGEYKWKNKEIAKLQNILGGTEQLRKEFSKIKLDSQFYEEAPFLAGIVDGLLLALKEGLIKKLEIISTTHGVDNRKKLVTDKTFGKFPGISNITLYKTGHHTKTGMKRCDWIKENHPDFDIFIDDNANIIEETKKVFANQPKKTYVLPDYKSNRHVQGSNVFHVKTTVSDLKYEDFEKAAEEYKARKKEHRLQTQNPKNYWPWIIGGSLVGSSLIILLGIYFWNRKRKKKNLV